MASMMMPEKKVFRARVLDPTKRLPIRFRENCRIKSPKIKRAVAVPPSGMEKEEEMESHLQQAIYAQKATSAGAVVENHVIPTPKVSSLDQDLYEQIYKDRSERSKKLIVFKDFVSFFLNQSVYDADSEDEEWLNTKLNIPIDQFEQIIVKLELASQYDIIQPSDAKVLLHKFNSQIVDDVYDYWLQKRKQVASNLYKYSILMPRLNTESRREEKTINPYIAFRRRLDKVQTRKKQKTEIQTYEKILRLNYAMKRSIVLVEMMKQREKSKLALVDLNEAIFERQCQLNDYENCELNRLTAEVSSKLSANKFNVPEVPFKKRMVVSAAQQLENGKFLNTLSFVNKNKYSQRKKVRPERKKVVNPTPVYNDENIVDESWLKWNKELWNRITPTTATNLGLKSTIVNANVSNSLASTTSSETMNLIAQYDVNSSVDGCYMFTRKLGCQYRAPTTMSIDFERYNINSNMSQRSHQQKTLIFDDDLLCKVIDGEPKFIGVEIPPLKEFDNEYKNFWPVLRHNSGLLNLETKQFRKDDLTGFDSDKNNFVNSSNIQKTGSFCFIRRRMGRGGRILYDLKF